VYKAWAKGVSEKHGNKPVVFTEIGSENTLLLPFYN
jgi:hypothetical protein